jgi:hypothetical protein
VKRLELVTVAVMTAVAIASVAPFADTPASRRDADLLRQKVATISSRAERAVRQPGRTTVTEREVNAYLVFDARDMLPAGVVDPSVSILGTGRLSGRAVVDLDAVRKAKSSPSLLDPTNYLTGRLPVTAVGLLQTHDGVGRFRLENATIGGLPVPKMLLQEIVSYYSRSTDRPSGIGLDDPFALPARIREIQVERGQAIIVQ